MEEKHKKISIVFVVAGIFINFINTIFFCGPDFHYGINHCINPFYEIWSFLAFLAGVLGIAIFPLILSTGISLFLIFLLRREKRGFLYYFSVSFFVLSLIALFLSMHPDSPELGLSDSLVSWTIFAYIIIVIVWIVSNFKSKPTKINGEQKEKHLPAQVFNGEKEKNGK